MFGKVAVLMGGASAEREVSLMSGKRVLAALKRKGIDAVAIDAVDNYIQELIAGQFDLVFIVLHGPGGEDGSVQGLLDTLGIPYTGSGVLGSAICMDKIRSKRIWQSVGLPTPPFTQISAEQDPRKLLKSFGVPLAIKPIYEGSTLGVTKLTKAAEYQQAYEYAAQYGPVMAEQWITGDEFTVGFLGDQALPSVQIVPPSQFYDYKAKYFSSETQYLCPSPLTEVEEKYVTQLAKQAYEVLGGEGWGRLDFIRDLNGDFWLLEANTIPGLTEHSLVPVAAKVAGLSFDELIIEILTEAHLNHETACKRNLDSRTT